MENEDIRYKLISAVHTGNLQMVRELIDKYGLSYSQAWSNGYILLQDALEQQEFPIAKLLLTKCAEVNSINIDFWTPLHVAVHHQNITVTQMIIDRGAVINAKDTMGRTPLHIAVYFNNEKITEILLKHRADVNATDNRGESLLHLAVTYDYINIVDHLLKYGASTDDVLPWHSPGFTPLHYATEKGRKEVIKLLLNSGANVDVKCENDITPLHIAASKGYDDIANILLNHGACILSSTLKKGLSPLHFACTRASNEKLVILLLNRGADINAAANDKSTPLHCAVVSTRPGRSAIVKLLLEYSPDLDNQSNRKSLKTAVLSPDSIYGQSSNIENQSIIEALLDYGFTMHPHDVNDSELMYTAVRKGYYKIVKCLLESDPNGNTANTSINGNSLLHYAVIYQHEEIASLLIRHGADVNALNNCMSTPLYKSVFNKDLKMSLLLLNNGANVENNPELMNFAFNSSVEIVRAIFQHDVDVNSVNSNGSTALHISADKDNSIYKNDWTEIAKLLLDKGANVKALDNNKKTPLHIAIQRGNVAVFKTILEHNANIALHFGAENDITPLHLVAQTIHVEMLTFLLSKGVDINAQMKNGYSALHLAVREGLTNVVNILLKHGANVEQVTGDGRQPLHLAAEGNYHDVIESLLKFGADINSRSIKDGKAALHIACDKRFDDLISFLLQHGSDINITCSNNQSPLDYALKRSTSGSFSVALNRHIIKLLCAGLFVAKNNIQTKELMLCASPKSYYWLMCEKEVANMKTEMISANISFYDILKKDSSCLAIPYLRNDKIVQVLNSSEYKTTFPIYATMIERHFRSSLVKRELLEKAYKIIPLLFKHLPELPYNCIEGILSYLSNEDLEVLLNNLVK